MYTLEWISEKQHKKIMEYLSLLKEEDVFNPKGMSDAEYEKEMLRLLAILEAFDNSPQKAANAFYSAKKNAAKAMDRVYELMLAHIPKPTHEHFHDAFPSIEAAEAFKKKVNEEGMKAYKEVITREFHQVYFDHKWNELESMQTLH